MVRMCSFARHVRHRPHHRNRADGQHQVDARAVLDQLPQLVGDEALVSVAAVVGRDHQHVADLAHFVFQDDQLFVARPNDGDDPVAGLFQRRRRGIGHGRSDAAAHDHHRAELLDLRRFSQRPDHIQNGVAGFERIEQVGGLADRLHHDVDGARSRGRISRW